MFSLRIVQRYLNTTAFKDDSYILIVAIFIIPDKNS